MAPRPTAERPPSGLDAYWTRTWNHALTVLKDQGTWAWEQKPLLDEYVHALRAAQQAREGFDWLERLEDVATEPPDFIALAKIAGGLPTQWDRHTKRAAALADQLALTPRGRKAVGLADHGDDPADSLDPFDRLAQDELAPRRQSRR